MASTAAQGSIRTILTPAASGLIAPLGMLALVVVGLHAGADRLDDHLFALLAAVDSALDALLAALIHRAGAFLGAQPASIERAAYAAADLIDLPVKQAAARYGALILELAADAILALPLLLPAPSRAPSLRFLLNHPGAVAAVPLAVAAAALAGLPVVAREIEAGTFGLARDLHANPGIAAGLARGAGLGALALAAWYLAIAATVRATRRAARRTERELEGRPHRLRSAAILLLALPVAAVALIEATPLVAGLRALLLP